MSTVSYCVHPYSAPCLLQDACSVPTICFFYSACNAAAKEEQRVCVFATKPPRADVDALHAKLVKAFLRFYFGSRILAPESSMLLLLWRDADCKSSAVVPSASFWLVVPRCFAAFVEI